MASSSPPHLGLGAHLASGWKPTQHSLHPQQMGKWGAQSCSPDSVTAGRGPHTIRRASPHPPPHPTPRLPVGSGAGGSDKRTAVRQLPQPARFPRNRVCVSSKHSASCSSCSSCQVLLVLREDDELLEREGFGCRGGSFARPIVENSKGLLPQFICL